jgi:protease-4
VIASYGEYAASGGYWISCGADKIFSDKTTLTGSIGVFGLIPSFGKALKKNLYLNVYEVSTHKHGSMANGMNPLDPDEVAVMQGQIEHIYTDFVSLVSTGRGMTAEAVDNIAQGRVWAGGDAIGIGLVDEWGGLADAIRYAASMVSLDTYRLAEYPDVPTMYDQLLASMAEEGTEQDIRTSPLTLTERTGNWLLGIQGPEVVARMDNIELILQ